MPIGTARHHLCIPCLVFRDKVAGKEAQDLLCIRRAKLSKNRILCPGPLKASASPPALIQDKIQAQAVISDQRSSLITAFK